MTFAFHHPNYYKKLKQNSGRSAVTVPSKDTVSEDCIPSTMETTVGAVGRLSPTHTNQKENK